MQPVRSGPSARPTYQAATRRLLDEVYQLERARASAMITSTAFSQQSHTYYGHFLISLFLSFGDL